jgi:hypothetical protein
VNTEPSLVELAKVFAEIGRELGESTESDAVFDTLTRLAVDRVPGAEQASVTRGRNGHFETLAPTNEVVVAVDKLQYELGSGPCVDALLTDTVFLTGNLAADGRWPKFGARAQQVTGINSMLSIRLFVESDGSILAGLNMYSFEPDAFDETSLHMGLILATHGTLAVQAATARHKAENLNRALATSRDIGIAIGILMATHKVTRDQGFNLLRIASQNSHAKLADIAADVVESGAVPPPTSRKSRPSGR